MAATGLLVKNIAIPKTAGKGICLGRAIGDHGPIVGIKQSVEGFVIGVGNIKILVGNTENIFIVKCGGINAGRWQRGIAAHIII